MWLRRNKYCKIDTISIFPSSEATCHKKKLQQFPSGEKLCCAVWISVNTYWLVWRPQGLVQQNVTICGSPVLELCIKPAMKSTQSAILIWLYWALGTYPCIYEPHGPVASHQQQTLFNCCRIPFVARHQTNEQCVVGQHRWSQSKQIKNFPSMLQQPRTLNKWSKPNLCH